MEARVTGRARLPALRQLLPREHGAWVMVGVPVILGATATRVDGAQIALLVGALLVYMAASALLALVRRRRVQSRRLVGSPAARAAAHPGDLALVLVLAAVAALALAVPLRRAPGLAWVGLAGVAFLAASCGFVWLDRERSLASGMASIAGLTLGAPAAYLLGSGRVDASAFLLWGLCAAFFAGSLLFVKSSLRERGARWHLVASLGWSAAVPALMLALGRPLLALAFTPSFVRALAFLPLRRPRPLHIGLAELTNSMVFTATLVVALRGG